MDFLKTGAEIDERPTDTSSTVARRFWGLLIVVLVLAVAASAVAVRQSATPYLAEKQRQAITEQALKVARNVDAILARHKLFLSFVSGNEQVVSTALGYVPTNEFVLDYFENLRWPEGASWLRLYDAFGDLLASYETAPTERIPFENRVLSEFARAFDEQGAAAGTRALLWDDGGTLRIVLAEPVFNGNFIEGVLIAGFNLDAAAVLTRTDVAEATYLIEATNLEDAMAIAPTGAVVVQLPTLDLAVVQVPDLASVAEAGRVLLQTTVSAIAVVLVAAFALFAWLGRAAIVEPHRRLERQKRELSELAAISERADDAILVTDLDGRGVWANPAFERLSGYSIKDIEGAVCPSILYGDSTDPVTAKDVEAALARQQSIKTEIAFTSKSSCEFWVSLSLSPLSLDDGKVYGFSMISHDITEARRQREVILQTSREIEHQALHDPLTGLPNRRALDVALKERGGDAEGATTIVRIDLDHFKYVNDTMGHEAGDFLLCAVANILRRETTEDDLPVRVGGDEFLILLAPGKTSQDGQTLAQRILEYIREPKAYEDKTLRVGSSFGVASTDDGLAELDALIIGADAALYEAKNLGRNTVRLYSPELHRAVLDRRTLAREIRRGIAQEEFEPYFQPQIDAVTRQIVGVETLARWHSPDLGLVFPNTFMPVARQLSVIEDIDAIIFSKAIDQIVSLHERGVNIPKVSFNVTAERIQNQTSFDVVRANLGRGPKISFEILESVLVEDQTDLFAFSLDRLRDSGVMIEVDDFGSGHASVIGLMQLLPDAMKIDQRLIMPITWDKTTRGMLKQIFGMAELLGLQVTAEGVETMEHADILEELGCNTLQGHAFARAMPIDDLLEFARKNAGGRNALSA